MAQVLHCMLCHMRDGTCVHERESALRFPVTKQKSSVLLQDNYFLSGNTHLPFGALTVHMSFWCFKTLPLQTQHIINKLIRFISGSQCSAWFQSIQPLLFSSRPLGASVLCVVEMLHACLHYTTAEMPEHIMNTRYQSRAAELSGRDQSSPGQPATGS